MSDPPARDSDPPAGDRRSFTTNPHLCWRHPVARICGAFSVLALDMFLYGEDPVNDSHVEAHLPGIGHMLSLVFFPLAPTAGVGILRLVLALLSIFVGMVVGRQLVHGRFLRDFCRLSMFQDRDGSICIMVLTAAVAILLGSQVHNVLVGFSERLSITEALGFQMRYFGKLAQCCSVTADLIAVNMITDAVLQDTIRYPNWFPKGKRFWTNAYSGYVRIVGVWGFTVVGTALLVWGIFSTGKDPEDFKWEDRRIGGLNEFQRALLVSLIIFVDLFTVVQDWDFPTFKEPLNLDVPVLIAGTWAAEARFSFLFNLLERAPGVPDRIRHSWLGRHLPPIEFFRFSVTGKWITYGPLLAIMGLDFFSVRTQLFYDPIIYGQYVDPRDTHIWTIVNETYLAEVYQKGVPTDASLISYSARRNSTTGAARADCPSAMSDVRLNSRHIHSYWKFSCLFLGLMLLGVFLCLVVRGDKERKVRGSMTGSCSHQLGPATLSPASSCSPAALPPTSSHGPEPAGEADKIAQAIEAAVGLIASSCSPAAVAPTPLGRASPDALGPDGAQGSADESAMHPVCAEDPSHGEAPQRLLAPGSPSSPGAGRAPKARTPPQKDGRVPSKVGGRQPPQKSAV